MKVLRVLVLISVIYGTTFLLVNDYVNAQETKLPLTIEPIYPENQNPQTKGYFDLTINQGARQSLSVRIINKNNNEVNVSMKSANVFTNATGGMMYEKKIESPDTVLLDDAVHMADYIKVEEAITVPLMFQK